MKDHDLLGSLDGTSSSAASGHAAPDHTATVPRCSRKGCQADAAWRLEWNNPRIHTPERRKTWLACGDHREWLADYLRSRGLLKDVLPVDLEDRT